MTMQPDDLKAIRKALDMTQQQLADAMGLSKAFISMMERGDKPIELRTELAAQALLIIRRQFLVVESDGRFHIAKRFMKRQPSADAMASFYGGIVLQDGEYSTFDEAQAVADRLNELVGIGV